MAKRTWKKGNGGAYYSSNIIAVCDGKKMSDFMITRHINNHDKWVLCYFNMTHYQYLPTPLVPLFNTVTEAQEFVKIGGVENGIRCTFRFIT